MTDISTCYLVSKTLNNHAKKFYPSFAIEKSFGFDASPYSALCYEHPYLYAREFSETAHSIIKFKLDEGASTFTQVLEVKPIRETQGALLRYSGSRNCLIANEHPFWNGYLVFIDLSHDKYRIIRHRFGGHRINAMSDLFQCSGDLTESYYIWITPTVEDIEFDPVCMYLWKVDNDLKSIKRLNSIPVHRYDIHHDLAVDSCIDYCNSRVADVSLEFHEAINGIDILQGPINLVGVKVQRYNSSLIGTTTLVDSFEIPKRSIIRGNRNTIRDFIILDNYIIIGLLDIGIDIYDLKFSRRFTTIPFPLLENYIRQVIIR